MQLKLVKPADAPLWLALPGAGWAAAMAGAYMAGVHRCLFKWLTGIPCPTCGGTRALLHLLRGELSAAWRAQPLLITGLLLGLAAYTVTAAVTLVWRRRLPVLQASRRAWCRLALLLLGLAVLNWGYLIARGG
ncbi:MAG: DUF2752 domain-containing protein [Kiritimatiellia bacterium]